MRKLLIALIASAFAVVWASALADDKTAADSVEKRERYTAERSHPLYYPNRSQAPVSQLNGSEKKAASKWAREKWQGLTPQQKQDIEAKAMSRLPSERTALDWIAIQESRLRSDKGQ